MTRPKTFLLLGLLLGPVALVGLVTWHLRNEAQDMVERAVTALSPFAEIRYSGVSVTFGGEVRVHGLDIRPRAINDSLRIESVHVETPGLWYLLTGTDELHAGTLPEHARVELNGVELGLSGAIADTLDDFLNAAAAAGGAAPMTNCGDIRMLDMKTHRRLGYSSFVFDIALGYRFEARRGPLQVHTAWRTRDLGAAEVDLEFSGAAARINDMLAADPRLRRFAVRYQDLSFTDRLKLLCAESAGKTVEQYMEAERNRSDADWQALWGFVPGPGLRQAYEDFLSRPGEVVIEGAPSAEIDMQALRLFKPEDVANVLNLRVSVNGKPVKDLSLSVATVTPATPNTPAAVPAERTEPAPRATAPAASETETALEGYRVIAPRELGNHVGATVRLHLSRGVVREGSLLQIRQGMARVERRYPGGTMTLVIPLGEIERAELQVQ